MKIRAISTIGPLLLVAISCRGTGDSGAPAIVQPGAPGQSSRTIGAAAAADLSKVGFTPADVRFMQGMIGHHAQALEMTAIVREHSQSDGLRTLAHRIELSQADEIKMMQDWLTARGQALPDPHAHHAASAPRSAVGGPEEMPASASAMMPGMLTPAELSQLATARGPELDRLFLQFMIKHHEGALVMVKDLLATPGAGQEADVFAFASDVDADQRMEIDRMRAALTASKEP